MALKPRSDQAVVSLARHLMTSSVSESLKPEQSGKVKTGILMLNMGGPQTSADVKDFLTRYETKKSKSSNQGKISGRA